MSAAGCAEAWAWASGDSHVCTIDSKSSQGEMQVLQASAEVGPVCVGRKQESKTVNCCTTTLPEAIENVPELDQAIPLLGHVVWTPPACGPSIPKA